MTLVLDTGPLIALADRKDPLKSRVEVLLQQEPGELVIPAPITAEVDYLLGKRLGRKARLAFLDDLAAGRFLVAGLDESDHRQVAELERKYEDIDAGLAHLSAVVMAAKHGTTRLLTFDERHFRTLRTVDGARFTLLPADDSTS